MPSDNFFCCNWKDITKRERVLGSIMSKIKIPMLKTSVSCGRYPGRKGHAKLSKIPSRNLFKPVEPDSAYSSVTEDENFVRPRCKRSK